MQDELGNDVKGSDRLGPPGEPQGEPAGPGQESTAGNSTENAGPEELNYKDHVQGEAGRAFRAIVVKLVLQAKDGSINHIKLLFELAGIMQQLKDLTGRKRYSTIGWLDVLSREFYNPQPTLPAPEPTVTAEQADMKTSDGNSGSETQP